MLLIVNNIQTKFCKWVCAICNLHSCYNFALVLHEKSLIFSQSEACNFIKYINIYLKLELCNLELDTERVRVMDPANHFSFTSIGPFEGLAV